MQAKHPTLIGPDGGLDAPALVSEYSRNLDASEATVKTYTANVRRYALWLASEGRTGLERADVIDYRAHLLEGMGASSVSAHLSSVRSFYSWLQSAYGVSDVAGAVKSPKRSKDPMRDPLTTAQARRVLEAIDAGTEAGARDYALISLMIHTGLRCCEVATAQIGDMRNLGDSVVLFVQGKGRDAKDAYVVVPEGVEASIANYLALRGGSRLDADAPLFASVSRKSRGGPIDRQTVSDVVKARFKAVGIDSERLTAHSLRHSAVTYALMGGASIQQVQAMARHADPRTTMVYAHNLERLTSPAESVVSEVLGLRGRRGLFQTLSSAPGERVKTVAIVSQKGGVGKSTLAYELAYWLREAKDLKVLAVDLDGQGTLTRLMGYAHPVRPEIASFGLLTGSRAGDCILPLDTGDLSPACAQLSDVDRALPERDRLGALKRSLGTLKGYDVCVLDCPPAMGAIDYNALIASDGLIIPTVSDYSSVVTLGPLSRTLKAVREGPNPSLDVLGMIVNQWDGRLRVARDYYPDIERYAQALGTEVLGTVRRSVAVSDAQADGFPLLRKSPSHPQARDMAEAFGKAFGGWMIE